MSNARGKKKKKPHINKKPIEQINYSMEDVLSMMDETSQIIAQENATRLSSMGPAASESGTLTDSVEFWNWMNRNYSKSGHFASAENMRAYMSETPGQQNWAKKVVQGKGYEWDWMTSQRKSFKNLFKVFDAGNVANRPGSDVTVRDLLTGAKTEQQLKAYTSKNAPHLKNTPQEMTVVTNAEKVKVVKEMGYEDVVSFGDNKAIKAARDARLEDMVTGKATPNYNIKNVSVTVAKAGMVGFVINIGVESILSYKKWKSGKISTWEYIKEIMKSGGNAGATSTLAAGIMIPVTSTITTAGVSALVTFPISFVIATSVDKIVAPAFARGNYKKILNEAKYYGSLIEFCVSLANTMDIASVQYVGFVGQMVSQQQRFSDLAGNVISQQAIEDFEYFASLPTEEVGVIVTGMVSLLNDTDSKYDSLKNQNWFQRMLKTVTGKNKSTKEDIHANYERLGVYVSKAVEVLYHRQCIDEKILVIYGEQIIALCKNHISLNARIEEIESWKKSVNDSLLLMKSPQNEIRVTSVQQLVDDAAQKLYMEAEKLFLEGHLIDAFAAFKSAAENGVGRAYYYLGEYFCNGYGHIKENTSIALEYYRKGMELGEPLSTYEYGCLKYIDDAYQIRSWTRKHIHSVIRLMKDGDNAALYLFGSHLIADHLEDEGLDIILDSVVDSLKYFKEAAKNGYWPAAYKFYQATEEIRKSGTLMPDYTNLFVNVEWYMAHFIYGMFEVLCGSEDYDKCARHFQKALWLRDDKTESAGFLAFLLNTGLVKDSIANGFSRGNIPMYYEAGLDSEDETVLGQLGLLYMTGLSKEGIRHIEDDGIGKNSEKAYAHLSKSYSIFHHKKEKNQPVMLAMYGLVAGLLGSLCFMGEGTSEDLQAAYQYLSVGHNLGDPQATYLLAVCYKEGLGTKKNLDKANQLLSELKAMPIPGMEQIPLL